ncbi:LPXTG cell wall anchor domain-containing protein [Polaromonas sp.]|nr:LPXTG cell wall anchor domain-containing protein [Candidatus Saccharibacteria bacterium]
MYGGGSAGLVGPVIAVSTTVGAVTLPNTGGNFIVTLAAAVAAGMVVWGIMYARSSRLG